jgi:acyl-homoserine-lactone acylase
MSLQRIFPALLAGLVACSDSNDSFDPALEGPELSAQVVRTEYGIPHVTADDWESLGYGIGYAYAQDNFCVTMKEVIYSIGRSAELLGEEDGGDVNDDLLFTYLTGPRAIFERDFIDPLPQRVKDLNDGFARGMNRYLAETGVENLPEGDQGCRNEDWVFPIDGTDLFLLQRRQALRGSSGNGTFSSAILATEGPDVGTTATSAPVQPEALRRAFEKLGRGLQDPDLGSNALALGRDITQTGTGLLLGNPHQPWFGEGAWYQAHLTIPGELDVAGAALHGFPYIGIGFNKDLAWTHTVSIANRYSLYELELTDDPLQYVYDGEIRDIEPIEVTVQSMQSDGSLEEVTKIFYESQFGPIVNFGSLDPLLDGWPLITGTILAFKDANLETGVRGSEQWLVKATATNLTEYREAISEIGNPVFHELAADRNGDAFYGDISAMPFIDQAKIDNCLTPFIGVALAAETTNVLLTLDGSTSDCEWGIDPEAPEGTGLYGASALPQLQTTDYVGNSNNSYWLSDANNPLTGFPTVMGPVGYEGLQQFLRTRIGHLMVEERRTATDGISATPLFDMETLKAFMYNNRVYGAEINLDDVLTVCGDAAASGVQEACDVLAAWDRKVELDSRGAQVWKEFWDYVRDEKGNSFQNVVDDEEFWAVDFDPADPLNTPAGIDLAVPENFTFVIAALAEATQRLADNNVALDARWGDIQYLERGADNVPIHGGQGTLGIYGAISSRLSDGGYINPSSGNSYIQVVTWDESDCPIADVILVPSQSTDPESPHFADQTMLYSNKEWVRFPFCEDDILANQIGDTLTLEE